jgi:hypothetical protein
MMRRKPHEDHEPPIYCACKCGKRLTIAAVVGGSKFATRKCAGLEGNRDQDQEPPADELLDDVA